MKEQYPTHREDKKYSDLYDNHYRDGGGNRINYLLRFIDVKNKSIIEFGCGRGKLRNRLPHNGYIGVDIASTLKKNAENWKDNEIFVHADIRWYETKQKSDISISMDVLEHIEECSIDSVIKNMIDAGETCIMGISCRPAIVKSETGDNLHLTVKPPEWWIKKVRKHGNIAHLHVSSDKTYVTIIVTERKIMGNKMTQAMMPETINGIRITMALDGSYTIPRRNKIAETFLDSVGIRSPRQLRWYLPLEGFGIEFTETVYIVGKGPSLDNLRREDFEPDYTIICINEAIHKVLEFGLDNPIFVFSQDENLGDTCKVLGPNYIIAPRIAKFYRGHPNTTVINPKSVGPTASTITVNFAIYTARQFGAKNFKLICFDACVNQNTEYADCIGHPSTKGGDPKRFLNHRQVITSALGNCNYEFIIPTVHPSEVSGIPQQ